MVISETDQKQITAIDDKIAQYKSGIDSGIWSRLFVKHAKKQIRKLKSERAVLEFRGVKNQK